MKQKTKEIVKNPDFVAMAERRLSPKQLVAFRDTEDRKRNPIVDVSFTANVGLIKVVTFMSYAQCGNLLGRD